MEMLKKVSAALMLFCMVLIISSHHDAEAAITCNQVVGKLTPCIPFLRNGGLVSAACCNGVRSLNSAAATTPDRQATCRCLISAAKSISGINLSNANKLPGACGVRIPYPISTTTDCSKIQ